MSEPAEPRPSDAPAAETLAVVATALTAYAVNAGLKVSDAPQLVADTFVGGRGEASAGLKARDLPAFRRGISLGRHPVILGLLPEPPDGAGLADALRQHRNQCVVARGALSPNAALDLVLVLIAPRGSEGRDAWRATALAIERDDRVARKLVWLRPADRRDDPDSFDAFAKRTFLARPWATTARFSVATLDDIAAELDSGSNARDTSGRWIRLAVERGGNPDHLVDGLVEVWNERSS